VNLPGLSSLLNRSSNGPVLCRKVFYAAPDVAEGLGDVIPSAWSPLLTAAHGSALGALSFLTGIEIITAEDVPPGFFRLVHHDGCKVKSGTTTVSHEKCTIIAEGFVDLTVRNAADDGRPFGFHEFGQNDGRAPGS
jgi:hypothetical protein